MSQPMQFQGNAEQKGGRGGPGNVTDEVVEKTDLGKNKEQQSY